MARVHAKPSICDIWHAGNGPPAAPDITIECYLQQGRFEWEYAPDGSAYDFVPSVLYIPYGTDVRHGSVEDRSAGDKVTVHGWDGMLFNVFEVQVCNLDTPDVELRCRMFPTDWSYPLAGF